MRIIRAAEGGFIIDVENKVDLPIICADKKKLHEKIDELFPDE